MSDQIIAPEEQEKRIDPFSLFSEQVQFAVRGLAFIGHISKEINYCGHTFSIRTLYPAEKAAISLAVKEYHGTISEGEVWANAQVAMALQSIDGVDDFCPSLGPDLVESVKGRLAWVSQQWHQATLGYLYGRQLELEQEALDGIRELQDFSERNRVLSPASPDSLTEPDTSGGEIDTDTLS